MTPAKRRALARCLRAIGNGGTINGVYQLGPVKALEAFRADLKLAADELDPAQ